MLHKPPGIAAPTSRTDCGTLDLSALDAPCQEFICLHASKYLAYWEFLETHSDDINFTERQILDIAFKACVSGDRTLSQGCVRKALLLSRWKTLALTEREGFAKHMYNRQLWNDAGPGFPEEVTAINRMFDLRMRAGARDLISERVLKTRNASDMDVEAALASLTTSADAVSALFDEVVQQVRKSPHMDSDFPENKSIALCDHFFNRLIDEASISSEMDDICLRTAVLHHETDKLVDRWVLLCRDSCPDFKDILVRLVDVQTAHARAMHDIGMITRSARSYSRAAPRAPSKAPESLELGWRVTVASEKPRADVERPARPKRGDTSTNQSLIQPFEEDREVV